MKSYCDLIRKGRKEARIQRLSKDAPTVVVHFDLPGSTKAFKNNQNQQVGINRMIQHNEICRQFVQKFGGEVIKDIGDAVFARFSTSASAIRCANDTIVSMKTCSKKQVNGLATKITITTGKMRFWYRKNNKDMLGEAVLRCFKMSSHAKENTILFDEGIRKQLEFRLDLVKNIRKLEGKIVVPFGKIPLYTTTPRKLLSQP